MVFQLIQYIYVLLQYSTLFLGHPFCTEQEALWLIALYYKRGVPLVVVVVIREELLYKTIFLFH
jgi:hypothetical protein